jgi:hypothetical protein
MSIDRTLFRLAECWSSHNADEFYHFSQKIAFTKMWLRAGSNGKGELRAFYEIGFTAIPDHRMDFEVAIRNR